jgi:hypothetical protein
LLVTVPEPDFRTLKLYVVAVPVLALVAVVSVEPVSPPPPQAVKKILRMRGRKNVVRAAILKAIMFCIPSCSTNSSLSCHPDHTVDGHWLVCGSRLIRLLHKAKIAKSESWIKRKWLILWINGRLSDERSER